MTDDKGYTMEIKDGKGIPKMEAEITEIENLKDRARVLEIKLDTLTHLLRPFFAGKGP